jgi:uncharacterized membrane protein YhaH (DUF805 family)
MSFAAAIQSFFKNYANFNGRARRSEFWYSLLFYGLVAFVLNLVMPGTPTMLPDGTVIPAVGLLASLWQLAVLVPGLAVVWRRLHDVDKGGPYYFMGLIPLVGAILLLIQFAKEGTPGANRFGEPVK